MKSIKKSMETYLSEEVKRLSDKYGFVHEEAMEYLRGDGDGVGLLLDETVEFTSSFEFILRKAVELIKFFYN